MGLGVDAPPPDPPGGQNYFHVKLWKTWIFQCPFMILGNHNGPRWKFSMQKCIKGKFYTIPFDPWRTSLRPEKKISPRNAIKWGFRKSILTLTTQGSYHAYLCNYSWKYRRLEENLLEWNPGFSAWIIAQPNVTYMHIRRRGTSLICKDHLVRALLDCQAKENPN